MKADVTIAFTIDTRWARRWVQVCRAVGILFGERRAVALAMWGVGRLVRYRVGTGRWAKLT